MSHNSNITNQEINNKFTLDDIYSISIDNQKFLLNLRKNNEETYYEATKEDINIIFPHIIKFCGQEEKYLTNTYRTVFIKLTNELITALNIPEQQTALITNSNDYVKLVHDLGLKDKYCLLFCGQIIKDFSTEEEMDQYCKQIPNIDFTKYYPRCT